MTVKDSRTELNEKGVHKVNDMSEIGPLKLVCWKIDHYRALVREHKFISWIYYCYIHTGAI